MLSLRRKHQCHQVTVPSKLWSIQTTRGTQREAMSLYRMLRQLQMRCSLPCRREELSLEVPLLIMSHGKRGRSRRKTLTRRWISCANAPSESQRNWPWTTAKSTWLKTLFMRTRILCSSKNRPERPLPRLWKFPAYPTKEVQSRGRLPSGWLRDWYAKE